MAIIVNEDARAAGHASPAIDVTKIIVWIAAASLPWAAIILAVKAVIAALA